MLVLFERSDRPPLHHAFLRHMACMHDRFALKRSFYATQCFPIICKILLNFHERPYVVSFNSHGLNQHFFLLNQLQLFFSRGYMMNGFFVARRDGRFFFFFLSIGILDKFYTFYFYLYLYYNVIRMFPLNLVRL